RQRVLEVLGRTLCLEGDRILKAKRRIRSRLAGKVRRNLLLAPAFRYPSFDSTGVDAVNNLEIGTNVAVTLNMRHHRQYREVEYFRLLGDRLQIVIDESERGVVHTLDVIHRALFLPRLTHKLRDRRAGHFHYANHDGLYSVVT